jgi:hypothetical protein
VTNSICENLSRVRTEIGGEAAAVIQESDRSSSDRNVLAHEFDFSGVEPGANFDPERAHFVANARGAPDGPRWSIKSRDKSVPARVNLTPSKAGQLAANDLLMSLEQIQPRPIAVTNNSFCRANNVSEKNRREHAVQVGCWSAS